MRPVRLAMALAGALCAGTALAQPPSVLTITAPAADSYVTGTTVLRARVDPSAPAVRSVVFFADGRAACTVEAPPYECAWDAGQAIREHVIRVVATLRDGTRVARSVRTKGAGYTERVEVEAVQVTVTVTDNRGKLVKALPREAFRVREDGVPQKITAFSSENIPLEIVVALDVSHSMTDAIPTLKDAARRFLGALRPQDQVTLLAFNDNIFTLARRSTNPAQRLRAVDRLAPWGGTALYDVILTALDLVGKQPGRRALVLFTDGEDQSSVATIPRVKQRMETSDATVYTIGLGRGARESTLKDILEQLAAMSGGRAFVTERIEKLDDAFSAIVEELSNQYLLAYIPSNQRRDGSWRQIEVDLPGQKYIVRARRGYRAPSK
jgi:Ca-activated chloride channel family protein